MNTSTTSTEVRTAMRDKELAKQNAMSVISCAHHRMLIIYSSLRNQRESPLLRLPAELRIRIYEYALGGLEIRIIPRII